MASDFFHIPVLMEGVLSALAPQPGQVILDGTVGGAGHASRLAKAIAPGGLLVGIDRDDAALAAADERLKATGAAYHLIRGNFFEAPRLLEENGIGPLDGALVDLGVSSPQLDDAARGFSYQQDAPLDMRMDRRQALSAYDVVNGYSAQQLERILREYGEERFARRMAQRIVAERGKSPIATTRQLADIARAAIPRPAREADQHPARRLFQAVRIEVNGELDGLGEALEGLVGCLKPGGVLVVITFHSLEDRIAKRTFQRLADPCTCPREAPVCVCGKKPVIYRPEKSVTASAQELDQNPRSRSARLRTARRR
nr:16S rRNA (cytosine(1402)-N(4))-methyltransferase RsmH [bacterium]